MSKAKILIFAAFGCCILLVSSFYFEGVGGSGSRFQGPWPTSCYGDYTSSTIFVFIEDNGDIKVNGKVYYKGLLAKEAMKLKETCSEVDVLISEPKERSELYPGILGKIVGEANDVLSEGKYSTVVTRK